MWSQTGGVSEHPSDCPSPQNSIMKACMLVGVLVMVGFAVGKGKWEPGQGGRGGAGHLDARAPCRARDLE